MMVASSAERRGDAARVESFSSRAWISAAISSTVFPVASSSPDLRAARTAGDAVR